MMQKPEIKQDSMYMLLREEKIKEFNQRRAQGEPCPLQNADLRGLDLRGLDAKGLDLSGSYLRQADLRGVDLSTARAGRCEHQRRQDIRRLFSQGTQPGGDHPVPGARHPSALSLKPHQGVSSCVRMFRATRRWSASPSCKTS